MQLNKLQIKGIDPKRPMVIAGPCSAESREQIMQTAIGLSSKGIKIFRAGIWKPRTKPGGFEGVGVRGLQWIKEVKERTGMLTTVEVATAKHADDALKAGVDILWIGARTVANPFAVQELADFLRWSEIPVLIKNPVSPDIELWIGALERFHNAGIKNLGVIHRGFNSDEKSLYRNTPLWHIPIELRRRFPELTILCDPSHIGGRREYISTISQQAMDVNFDGLFVEAHCTPENAMSDAAQQLTPDALGEMLHNLVIRENPSDIGDIAGLRRHIDDIDDQILTLLSKRMSISREIGLFKKEHNMPILQSARYGEILSSSEQKALQMKLNPEFIAQIVKTIHEESVQIQMEIMQ